MESPFDIFRMEDAGSLVWRGSAASMDDAKARILELTQSWPGEYVIVNLQSGLRISIRANQNDGRGGASAPSEGHSRAKSAQEY